MLTKVRLATVLTCLFLREFSGFGGPRRGEKILDRDLRRIHGGLRATCEGVGDHLADRSAIKTDAFGGARPELR